MKKKRLWIIFIFSVVIYSVVFLSELRGPINELYLSKFVQKAVDAGDIREVESLLKKGANINRQGTGGLTGGTPLIWATSKSDLPMIRFLVQHGAVVNLKMSEGTTAIMYAKKTETAQLLIDLGANINERDFNQKTVNQYFEENRILLVKLRLNHQPVK